MPKKPQIAQPRAVTPADSFVSAKRSDPEAGADVPLQRVTIAISREAHTRLKVACARKRVPMADAMRKAVEDLVVEMEAS